jgi:hypothetical protein
VHSLPAVSQIGLSVAYSLMPISIAAIYWASARRYAEQSRTVARARILDLALCVPCYYLVPVTGPFDASPGFPAASVTGPPHPIRLEALLTACLDSFFHRALMCLLLAVAGGAVAGLLCLVAAALATLGFGEHYLFDLVMAVRYTRE